MPPEQLQPPSKKHSKKSIAIIVSAVLFLCLGSAIGAYLALKSRAEANYVHVLSSLNSDLVKDLSSGADTLTSFHAATRTINSLVIDDTTEFDYESIRTHIHQAKEATSTLLSKEIAECNNYRNLYLHSSEIPKDTAFRFIGADKRKNIADLRSVLMEMEDDTCTEIKAATGMYLYAIDEFDGMNNLTQMAVTDFEDKIAIQRLKEFSDGTKKLRYYDEIRESSTSESTRRIRLATEYLAAAHALSEVPHLTATSKEVGYFTRAQDDYLHFMETYDFGKPAHEEAKKDLRNTLKYYAYLKTANESANVDTGYSPSVLVSKVIYAALEVHITSPKPDLPNVSNVKELLASLQNDEYLPENLVLPTNNLTYKYINPSSADFIVTDAVTKKSYTLQLR